MPLCSSLPPHLYNLPKAFSSSRRQKLDLARMSAAPLPPVTCQHTSAPLQGQKAVMSAKQKRLSDL